MRCMSKKKKKYGKGGMMEDFRGWLDENEGKTVLVQWTPKAFVATILSKPRPSLPTKQVKK